MSLTKKRVHLYEVKDGITYDEDVDVYTSTASVLFEDGESLQDKLDNGVLSVDILGDINDLGTEDKSSLVASLNEINEIVQSNGALLESGGSKGGYAFAFGREELDGSWKSVSTLPYEFRQGGAIVCNGELHILGGAQSPYYTYHYKYNGSTWTKVSTLPYGFINGSSVVLNNEIHILGGAYSSTNLNTDYMHHYKYNGSSWESVSTLPYSLRGGSAVVYNNEIHIMGSDYDNTTYTRHCKFNGSKWISVSTLPYNFYYGEAIILNNEIHILGSGTSATYQKHYKYNGSSWVSVSTLPYPFYNSDIVVLDGEIYIMGSYYKSEHYKKHYKYNGSSWVSVSTLPYNFYMGNAILYRNLIHILGGNGGQTSHYAYISGTLLSGYVKSNTQLYYPNSYPISSNLQPIQDGFLVTEDGLVEILLGD